MFVKVVTLGILSLASWQALANGLALMNECDEHEIKTQNCHIQLGTYKLHVRSKKIRIDNGTWREVEAMPDLGEKAKWQSVRLRKIGSRPVVELLIWDAPKSEAKISGLHWMVYELNGAKWSQKVEQLVQKRRHIEKDEYFYDKKSSLGLKPQGPSGEIIWQMGRESGKF